MYSTSTHSNVPHALLEVAWAAILIDVQYWVLDGPNVAEGISFCPGPILEGNEDFSKHKSNNGRVDWGRMHTALVGHLKLLMKSTTLCGQQVQIAAKYKNTKSYSQVVSCTFLAVHASQGL